LTVFETASPTLRIALESFLIAGRRIIRPQSTRKAQMKTILMLIVGLMLAGCGSMENHVRNQKRELDMKRERLTAFQQGERYAVDTICVCP
jgi:hypothetical protein